MMLKARGLTKAFVLHLQGGVPIPVLDGVDVVPEAGRCMGESRRRRCC